MNTIVLWHTASQSRAQFYQLQNKVNFFFLSLLLLPLLACHINVVFRQGPHTRTSGCCCFPFAFHLYFLPCHLFLCRDIDWNRAHTVDAISCAAPSMVHGRSLPMSRKITLERRGVRFARRNRGMGHRRHRFQRGPLPQSTACARRTPHPSASRSLACQAVVPEQGFPASYLEAW